MVAALLVALALAALAALAVAKSRVPRVAGLRRVPQPVEVPWIGSTRAALRDPARLRDRLHARFGPVVASTFLGRRYIQVRGLADVRKILLAEHDAVETEWPPAIRSLLGAGSVSTTHFDAHKRLRAALAPVFAPRAVGAAVPRIAAILAKHFERWAAAGPGLHGVAAVKAATFEVIVDVGMGFPQSWCTPAALDRFGRLFDVWLAGFAPGAPKALAAALAARAEMIAIIEDAVVPAVKARRALAARPPPGCTLDRLADAVDDGGRELSTGALCTVALNLLFAGHETSSQVLSLLMRTLHPGGGGGGADHGADGDGGGARGAAASFRPDLLAALREEQAAVIAKHGPDLTQAAIDASPLAAACAKEQLRLTPVVTQVFRRTLKPVALADGTIGVPPGEVLVLDLEDTIARDARWADEPPASPLHASKFNPHRWLDGGLAARREGAFLPFGGGARYCVGWQLATVELTAALALLARRYTWRLASPGAPLAAFPKPRLPVDGLVMTVEEWAREE